MPFFIDTWYLVIAGIGFVLSAATQMWLMSSFKKWSQVPNSLNMTGAQVGKYLLANSSLAKVGGKPQFGGADGKMPGEVRLERVGGTLTDHYDPRAHTVRMSQPVADTPSIVAMAVVAHELGHVQQYEEGSGLIVMRNFLIPALRFSPTLAYALITAGFVFQAGNLIWLGILFFGVTVLFSVLTLPVEFDASRRGLKLLEEAGMLRTENDRKGSRAMLTAAASTYVAAATTSVLQLLYYISLARRSQ